MKSLWDSAESERWNSNELEQRIYSARLLAKQPDLGCTFGGTVSVKTTEKDPIGEPAELIYVHAAATNLARIEFRAVYPIASGSPASICSVCRDSQPAGWNYRSDWHRTNQIRQSRHWTHCFMR